MSETQAMKGLGCPRCGGVVPVPEGQVIVRCPASVSTVTISTPLCPSADFPVNACTNSKQSEVFPSPAVPVSTTLRNCPVAAGKQSRMSCRAG